MMGENVGLHRTTLISPPGMCLGRDAIRHHLVIVGSFFRLPHPPFLSVWMDHRPTNALHSAKGACFPLRLNLHNNLFFLWPAKN